MVVEANLAKLHDLPVVKENDFQSLQELATTVRWVVSILERLGYDSDLGATANLKVALNKLPPSLAWRWGERVVEFGQRPPTLADLDKWLNLQAAAGRSVQSTFGKPTAGARQRGAEPAYKKPFKAAIHAVLQLPGGDRGPGAPEQPSKGKTDRCADCDTSGHRLEQCNVFKKRALSERVVIAFDHRLCFRCMRPNHRAFVCKTQTKCEMPDCKTPSRHHTLLHDGWTNCDQETRVKVHTAGTGNVSVLLQHLPVTVCGPTGEKTVNALLDMGSQVSLINEQTALQIGLAGGPTETVHLSTVDAKTTHNSRRVRFKIRPYNGTTSGSAGNNEHAVSALTLSSFKLESPETDWSAQREKWPHLADIYLPVPVDTGSTELLLGADCFSLIVPREVREGPRGSPSAVRTELGWTVAGRHRPNIKADGARVSVTHVRANIGEADSDLDQLVRDFWQIESFGTKYLAPPRKSNDIQRAESILRETTRWTRTAYETGLLWKCSNIRLPESKSAALKRLKSLERQLERSRLATLYSGNLQSYVTKGYCRKLSAADADAPNDRTWYLPHHAVTSPAKPGKVRIVFDAAARSSGTSLNDNLLTGPDQLNSLIGVLMRFRQQPVARTADIKEMFHQVKVKEDDRPALRFLWRDLEQDRPPDIYEMNVLIFGATSSPCSATYTLRQCASDNADTHPEAAAAVYSRFYVDDLLTSVETEAEAVQLQKSVTEILDSTGFHLTKWNSSSPAVLDSVVDCDRTPEVNLDLENPNCVRALGVSWAVQDDCFTFKVAPADVPHTKRALLSRVSSVFDPLGLLAPLVLPAKCLLQSLWLHGFRWDEPITDERLVVAWRRWCDDLAELPRVKVPRCYHMAGSTVLARQLHVFGDVSEKTFGAVAYFRLQLDDGEVKVVFIAAKARVAPLKQLTLPRLELQAAVMCVRLAETVKTEHDFQIDSTTFWSDSQTVLKWIRSESRRYHTFVANRVTEIQDASSIASWRWVPGSINPSDICSRGCTAAELTESSWFTGPVFLTAPEDIWPAEREQPTAESEDSAEERVCLAISATPGDSRLLEADNYSSWLRLLRVTAWIQRFCRNTRAGATERVTGPLTSQELQEAELLWLQQAQTDEFGPELEALQKTCQSQVAAVYAVCSHTETKEISSESVAD